MNKEHGAMNKPGRGKADESVIHNSSLTTHNSLVPQLRFPEFRDAGEWEKRKLIDTADKKIKWSFIGGPFGSNLKSSDFVPEGIRVIQLQNIGDGEFVDGYKIFTSKEKADELLSNNIYSGEIILSKMGDPVGRACLIPDIHDRYVMCSDGIRLVVDENSNHKYFVYLLINSPNFRASVEKAATGSTRKRIGLDDLKKLPMWLPPKKEEQQKIADCLSSLDALIAAQTDKIDVLKTHKKGLMQQLFPREGEIVPRLRFPEFREAGEWELSPLGEKVKLLSGFPFKSQDISEDSSGIPLMRGINITEGYIRHNTNIDRFFLGDTEQLKKYRLKVNDLVIGMDGSKVGKNSAIVTKKDAGSLLIQRVARLRAKRVSTIQFIFQHVHSSKFHSYVDRINTSGGIPHISAKQISEFEIYFPPKEEEQQKIADCLSNLDTLIAAHMEKLDSHRNQKKGLMQQLFPSWDSGVTESG